MPRKPIDPLGHPIREELVELVKHVEVTAAEAVGYLPGDPSLPTVAYHLRVLEQAGLVRRIGGVYAPASPQK